MAKSENPAVTAGVDDTSATIRKLVEIVVEHNLAELDLETDGVRITIKGASAAVSAAPVHVVHAPAPAAVHATAPIATAPKPAADKRAGTVALEAPATGIFYRAAAPEDPPLISPGESVRVGQAIGVIEAMKVFSEVPAEKSGKVVDVVAQNGKLINMGDPIAYIEPA